MAERAKTEELAFNYCIRSLAAVARSEHDMRARLAQRGYEPPVVDAVITRLCQLGYLDDEAYAEMWARSRLGTKGLSASAVRRELKTKGIAEDIIDRELAGTDQVSEDRRAREVIERKIPRDVPTDRVERDRLKRRLAGVLARKGYAGSRVWRIVDEALSDASR